MIEIKNPKEKTYFICRSNDLIIKSYGIVAINQTMKTSHPIIDKYTIKSDWVLELEKNNIIVL